MVSFGRAPEVTFPRITQRFPLTLRHNAQRNGSQVSVARQSLDHKPGDRLQLTKPVRFGARPLSDFRFDKLKQAGYQPFVADSLEDIPALVDFLEEAFSQSPIPSTTTREERIKYFEGILTKGGFIYLIRKNHKLVGSAILRTDKDEEGHIRSVGVDENHRKRGIATTMIQGLIAEAERRQLPQVWLIAETERAERLYKGLGFKHTALYHHEGNFYPVMTLNLSSVEAPSKVTPAQTSAGIQPEVNASAQKDSPPSQNSWGRWLWDGLQAMVAWVVSKLKSFVGWMSPRWSQPSNS